MIIKQQLLALNLSSSGDNLSLICWRLNDRIHREDGPAIVYSNGEKYYFEEGFEIK